MNLYHQFLLARLLSLALIVGVWLPVAWLLLSRLFRLIHRHMRPPGQHAHQSQGH